MINRFFQWLAKPARSRQFNKILDAGIGHMNGGRLDQALVCFDELIRIAPVDTQPYRLKGSLYTVARDYKDALINYDKAVDLGDDVFDSTHGDVEAYIARGYIRAKQGDYGQAAEDFENALNLDSVFVRTHFDRSHFRAADEIGAEWAANPLYAYNIIRAIRQRAIIDGVTRAIDSWRSQRGLPRGLPRSVLGMAAYRVTEKFVGKGIDSPEQINGEFRRFISGGEGDYEGWTGIAYSREAWAMSASDEEIISGMTERLCQQIGDMAYEDVGIGITCAYVDDSHSRISVFIAIGFGLVDGGAYAVMRINQAREAAGVLPLAIHPALMEIARKYHPMLKMPDENMRQQDLIECRYLTPGSRARHLFSGSVSPFLSEVRPDAEELSYADVGNIAATALLSDHNGVLLRTDWQDIAVTTTLSSEEDSRGPRVEAEFLIAWRLSESERRPSDFPPPPDRAT